MQIEIAKNRLRKTGVENRWVCEQDAETWCGGKVQLQAAIRGNNIEVKQNAKGWRDLYEAAEPQNTSLPGQWAQLGSFERMCVLRCLRPDKVTVVGERNGTGGAGGFCPRPPPRPPPPGTDRPTDRQLLSVSVWLSLSVCQEL